MLSEGMQYMTLLELFDIKEAYRLPDAIMQSLMSDKAADMIQKVKAAGIINTRDIFQEEQGDRKTLKQDFTPDCICSLVAKLVKSGNCLDICSGTGALSKATAVKCGDVNEYEFSERTIPFACLDACVNGITGYISRSDCLREKTVETYHLQRQGEISIPQKTEVKNPEKYDNVVMNPPYSMKFEDTEDFQIMGFTIPKSKADYGFLLRGIEHLKEDGRLIAILPHGVLFRGQGEGKIREWLVREKMINAVIGLPDKLFLNTGIPVCLLVLQRNSPDILFIDASKDFEKKSAQNDMKKEQIQRIADTFAKRQNCEKYAHIATYGEIEKNEYNLNIPRYVDSYEEEPLPDIEVLLNDLKNISEEESFLQNELYKMLGNLTGSCHDMEQIKKHREILKPKSKKKVLQKECTGQIALGDLYGYAMQGNISY